MKPKPQRFLAVVTPHGRIDYQSLMIFRLNAKLSYIRIPFWLFVASQLFAAFAVLAVREIGYGLVIGATSGFAVAVALHRYDTEEAQP